MHTTRYLIAMRMIHIFYAFAHMIVKQIGEKI